MKTEYSVEIYEHIKNNEFCLIVTMRNKQTFFIGIFKKSELKDILKEIFNIFTLPEFSHIEDLKRRKFPVSDIFSIRNNYAQQTRNSKFYKNTEKEIFIK